MKNKEDLDSAIIYDRDYSYDYFGFKTLERSYLLRVNGKIAERPQVLVVHLSFSNLSCILPLCARQLMVSVAPTAHVDARCRGHP